MQKETKRKSIFDRIRHLEDALTKGREYLATGEHAAWQGFRPMFFDKVKDGRIAPPHKDWIRNVFIPRSERALKKAQDQLDKLL